MHVTKQQQACTSTSSRVCRNNLFSRGERHKRTRRGAAAAARGRTDCCYCQATNKLSYFASSASFSSPPLIDSGRERPLTQMPASDGRAATEGGSLNFQAATNPNGGGCVITHFFLAATDRRSLELFLLPLLFS